MRIAILTIMTLLVSSCSASEAGPALPKIETRYEVPQAVRAQLKNDSDRRSAWEFGLKVCRKGMEGQRSIGLFPEGIDDTQITSYCDCIMDESTRDLTTAEIAGMNANPESGLCRRYYRSVDSNEINQDAKPFKIEVR